MTLSAGARRGASPLIPIFKDSRKKSDLASLTAVWKTPLPLKKSPIAMQYFLVLFHGVVGRMTSHQVMDASCRSFSSPDRVHAEGSYSAKRLVSAF